MRFFFFFAHTAWHAELSPAGIKTHAACSGNTESQPLDCLGSLKNFF